MDGVFRSQIYVHIYTSYIILYFIMLYVILYYIVLYYIMLYFTVFFLDSTKRRTRFDQFFHPKSDFLFHPFRHPGKTCERFRKLWWTFRWLDPLNKMVGWLVGYRDEHSWAAKMAIIPILNNLFKKVATAWGFVWAPTFHESWEVFFC